MSTEYYHLVTAGAIGSFVGFALASLIWWHLYKQLQHEMEQ